MQAKSVRISDTTLRDGEQTPGVHLTPHQKVTIAEALATFGADTIEAGFPISSPGDHEAVRAVAAAIRDCEVMALARCLPKDIAATASALAEAAHPVIHLVLGVSGIHLEHKLRITRNQAVRSIEAAVREARHHAAQVQFSLEDATRADPIFLRQCVQTAIESGATRINIADTVGWATPEEFGALIRGVALFAEDKAIISAHCHNDLGLATANTIAAIRNGARQVEVTVNGIGERAGNAAAEEIAVILEAKGMAKTGLDLARIRELSALVAEITGVPVQPNRAIAGANAFAHSAGIHQDGIRKNPKSYECIAPKTVGADGHQFILTARSGRSALAHVAAMRGHVLSSGQVNTVYEAFIEKADKRQGPVDPGVLDGIVRSVLQAPPASPTG